MKLTKIEKFERKCRLQALKDCKGKIGCFGRVTVVVVPTCRGMAEFTVSICSHNDKFNRKRGEYEALNRWISGQTLPIECASENYGALDWQGAIADISLMVAF